MNELPLYKTGELLNLINSIYTTGTTKKIILQRIERKENNPVFFDAYQFKLLTRVCDLLLAQNEATRICNPAADIDQRLAQQNADGWRYAAMPADAVAYTNGLKGIDEFSWQLFAKPFEQLSILQQTTILNGLQQGKALGQHWNELPTRLFFEDLMAEVAFIFYSHPLAQQEIGFVGMADARGWTHIGLNEKDEIEMEEIKKAGA